MKRCRLRLLKFLVCLAALIGIQAGPALAAAPAAENLRYLFLIDHSPEMATRQIATVETIYYLVRTGFENQIQPGEKFALWFYGSRLQTNAPMTWQPERNLQLARNAANLFTGRIYSRVRPREKTLADAAPFIAASPRITIFIFTDGSQPLSGTPYDEAINNAIQRNRSAFLRDDKPLIITLTAKNREWIGGYVHTDLSQRFSNPETEVRDDLLDKALVAVRTAPTTKTNNPAEIDKARDVLRDALAGNSKPVDTNAPIPVAALQLAPSLKEPPPETPKEQPKPEEPKVEKPQPQVTVVPPLIAAPKPQEQKTEPPPQKPEPTHAPAEVASVPSPSPASPTKTAEPPPVVHEEPKPTVNEQPKPIIREEPKVTAKTAAPVASERPIELAQKPAQSVSSVLKPPPEPEKKEPEKSAVTTNTTPAMAPSKTPPAKPPPPVQTAVLAPPHKPFPLPILVAGLFTIAVAGAMLFRNARRRAKSPGSIITQALPRPGVPHRKEQ